MKKWIALVLSLVMALSMCSFATAEEKPTLTIWVQENLRIIDWETNLMTQWLEEQLGCNIDFEIQPATDYATKVNIALTVGAVEDLPDVVLGGMNDANVWEWAQAETIIPLTEYYKDPALAEHINLAKERTGVDYVSQITSPDGNVYAIASYNQSYGNEYPDKLWIYQPWLDQLGMEYPTTTEELYNVLKAVKETDLNGNGKADEIGLVGAAFDQSYDKWFDYLMNSFVYAGDGHFRTVIDGKVGAAYITEEWREGLRYIKKMMDEGLVLAENLTMNNDQVKTLMNTEENTVFGLVYSAPDMINKDLGRDVEMWCIGPVAGPNGVQLTAYVPSVANPSMVVTCNCENPELAFKLGDLLSSRYIGIAQRWGWEGIDWDYPENVADIANYKPSVEGFEISMVAYSDGTFWGGTDASNSSWRQNGPFVREYGIANGWGQDASKGDRYTEIFNIAAGMYQTSGWNPAEVIPKTIYTTDEQDAISEIEANLNSYVEESAAAFLTGSKDLDKDWDAYLAEIEKIGLEEYLATVQAVYDRMYKK